MAGFDSDGAWGAGGVAMRYPDMIESAADCLYAPGVSKAENIKAIVAAVAPKPVNVLVGHPVPYTLADLAHLGVRRISVGGALAGAAWGGFLRAARALAEGRFDGFADNAQHLELNKMMQTKPSR